MGTWAKLLRILLLEPDLLFSSQIESAARKNGHEVKLTTCLHDLIEALKEGEVFHKMIVNLDAIDNSETFTTLATQRGSQRIGYYSHVETKIAEEARQAGFDVVLPRRAFVIKLNELLAEV